MINGIAQTHKDRINVIVIYISEAHASDVWPIGKSAGTNNLKHRNIKDRIECIKKFKSEYNLDLSIFGDNMDDVFETEYAAWPFRYFVIKDSKILKIGQPSDSTFDVIELLDLITELSN